MKQAFFHAVRRLRRGWRSGELLILSLAIVIAVAASSAVNLYWQRVIAAITAQTGETMGADLMFSSRDPLPEDFTAQVAARGATLNPVVQFPSVVLAGEQTALASIKAVEPGFPLRGKLTLSREPFGPAELAPGIPARGEAWVDLRLWQELGLSQGAALKAGASEFRVTHLIVNEPGRGAGFADLAPRLLINAADLPDTSLLGEGSRAQYWLTVSAGPEEISALKRLKPPRGVRAISPRDARPALQEGLWAAGEFLGLASIAASLLSAAAIALCAWQYGQKLRDEVALLKVMGAGRVFISDTLTLQLLMLGLAAGAAGALLGLGAQEVIFRLLGEMTQARLPAPSLLPLLYAMGFALVLLLAFAAPPALQAVKTPPLRILQRDERASRVPVPVWLAALAGAVAVLWQQTKMLEAAVYVLAGAGVMCLSLAGLAWLLVKALTPLRERGGSAWRFGLGNLARRRGATIWQSVALGLALLALLLITVVRQDLLSTWQGSLKPDTPNQFLINIQPAQLNPLKEFFAQRGMKDLRIWPMARARLVALKGVEITPETFQDEETRRWINREFNLSWTDTLGDDNEITEGEWWGEAGRGQPWLSADRYAVERLKLKLGDTLTLDFAGQRVELTIKSFRTVKWDSFRPNFFLLAPPGVLDNVPAQWLTSFYLPPEQRSLLRELIGAFPNITAIDLVSIMGQVRSIMERIVSAVEFLFLFTLAAGFAVLLAAMEATRGERMRESALLRTLGASSATILRGLLAEYAVLGLLAGFTAAIAAQLAAWALAEQVFKLPYGPRPLFWIAGGLSGASLVTLLGWWSLRSALNTPPRSILNAA